MTNLEVHLVKQNRLALLSDTEKWITKVSLTAGGTPCPARQFGSGFHVVYLVFALNWRQLHAILVILLSRITSEHFHTYTDTTRDKKTNSKNKKRCTTCKHNRTSLNEVSLQFTATTRPRTDRAKDWVWVLWELYQCPCRQSQRSNYNATTSYRDTGILCRPGGTLAWQPGMVWGPGALACLM